MGFIVNQVNGDILEPGTGRILDQQVVAPILHQALQRNMVNLSEDFDSLDRSVLIGCDNVSENI